MAMKRLYEVDIVRTIAVLLALLIHLDFIYSSRSILGIYSYLIWLMTIKLGVVFVFVSGMMNQMVNLSRWKNNSSKVNKKMVKKGLVLMGVYVCYVAFFSMLMKMSLGVEAIVWNHIFLMKIFLTIGLIYVCMPGLFWLSDKLEDKWLIVLAVGLVIVSPLLTKLIGENLLTTILIDVKNNPYALIPMIGVFYFGYVYGNRYESWKTTTQIFLGALLALAVAVFVKDQIKVVIEANALLKPSLILMLEIITMVAMIVALRPVNKLMSKSSSQTKRLVALLLIPGSESFWFYFVGNVVINLYRWRRYLLDESNYYTAMIVMMTTAYVVSYWSFTRREKRAS